MITLSAWLSNSSGNAEKESVLQPNLKTLVNYRNTSI